MAELKSVKQPFFCDHPFHSTTDFLRVIDHGQLYLTLDRRLPLTLEYWSGKQFWHPFYLYPKKLPTPGLVADDICFTLASKTNIRIIIYPEFIKMNGDLVAYHPEAISIAQ